ncbi:MAG: hypothetical protein C4519_18790 [Desulfobacteraceae bacterium]|nr:MAG: hypothetical protein C4519_18790 [Desulfobacteraceae bacterium]
MMAGKRNATNKARTMMQRLRTMPHHITRWSGGKDRVKPILTCNLLNDDNYMHISIEVVMMDG